MGNINISLKDDAYKYLLSLKSEGKSFSDVILEFKKKSKEKGSKENIMKFFGVLKNEDIDWEEKEKNIKEFRTSFNKRLSNDRSR
jgi:predicted CopG family antitoxin